MIDTIGAMLVGVCLLGIIGCTAWHCKQRTDAADHGRDWAWFD